MTGGGVEMTKVLCEAFTLPPSDESAFPHQSYDQWTLESLAINR